MQVDESLVDSHLVGVPSLGSLSVRGLSGGNLENLGRESDRSLHAQFLALCSVDQVGTDFFQVLDVSRGQGDSDSVDFWGILLVLLACFVGIGDVHRCFV